RPDGPQCFQIGRGRPFGHADDGDVRAPDRGQRHRSARLAGADDEKVGAVGFGLPGNGIVLSAPVGTNAQREVGADLSMNVGPEVASQDLYDLWIGLEGLRWIESEARMLARRGVEVDQVDVARRPVA